MNNVLDDSLTSIQWLCQLESNKILENKRPPICNDKESIESQKQPENPYPKPHHSYATLIVLAINSSPEKRMTLQEIYSWIQDNYPYYKLAKKGWKNSIRHNLSLHKFFIKEKRPTVLHGKGSYWRISPEGKENLMKDIYMQHNNYNLQTPYTFLPHDPNRKLRPIMPKPGSENPAVQYVPYMPIMFVPGTMPSGPLAGYDQAATSTAEIEVIKASAEFEMKEHHSTSSVDGEMKGKAVTRKNENTTTQCMSPAVKSKQETALEPRQLPNILRRRKKIRETSPVVAEKEAMTPKQPTLAAINSQHHHHMTSSPKHHDTNIQYDLTSPLRYHNTSFDFFNGVCSPGFSPLRSPSNFKTGLTPINGDSSDSGIMMTPLKTGYNDLSWTPFKTGFTPIMTSPPQQSSALSCRKQLGLD